MFGKKKATDEFELPDEFKIPDVSEPSDESKSSDESDTSKDIDLSEKNNIILEKNIPDMSANTTDESYLDSLLDIVMGKHENEEEIDEELIEEVKNEGLKEEEIIEEEIKDEELDDEGLKDEEIEEEIKDEELKDEELKDEELDDEGLKEEEIIEEEIIEEEVIEEPEYDDELLIDSNAIEDIEEYIENSEEEQNELMIDSEENEEELEDIIELKELKELEEIVDFADDEHEDILENIFSESEEEEPIPEVRSKIEDTEFVLKDAEEKLLKVEPKKEGLLKSIFGKIFKNEEKVDKDEDEDGGGVNYHAENKRLLNELDEDDENSKKGKGKKAKKSKKTKESKSPKIKKPTDPEMNERVKLSPKVGFLLFSIIVVILVAVLAGGSVLSYRQRIKDATEYYVTKNYSAAYKMVESSNLVNTDQEFYNQLRLIMYVHRYYESYLNFKEMGMEANALDALVKGVGNYDFYKEQGKDYNVLDEMQYSYGLIKDILQNEYNISENEARELSLIEDRNIYSTRIYEIIDGME